MSNLEYADNVLILLSKDALKFLTSLTHLGTVVNTTHLTNEFLYDR